jgi:Ca2+-binding EF-hand superfamily protein
MHQENNKQQDEDNITEQTIHQLFVELDINHDGVLEPIEIQEYLRKLHLPYTDRYVKQIMM